MTRDEERHSGNLKKQYKQYLLDVSEQIRHKSQKKRDDIERDRTLEKEIIRVENETMKDNLNSKWSRRNDQNKQLEEMKKSVELQKQEKALKRLEDQSKEREMIQLQEENILIKNRQHIMRKKVVSV